MKSDLDRLMQERGFDTIVVMGLAEGNHTLRYMTNGAVITEGIVIKQHDRQPVLICGPMERDEAAKSGLTVVTYADFDLYKLAKELGNAFEANLHMMAAIFERYQVTGTVSFNGVGDPGRSFMMLSRLSEMLPTIKITGETETGIFDEAYATKDAQEMVAIRTIAGHTNTVMGEVVDFIKRHEVRDNALVKPDGKPLAIGDVKRFLRGRLLEYGLEDNGETIFAIGRDAGIPHSRGEDGDPLKLGQSIVFDLFPRALGGGYYHDMTRTFCLGYAPDDVRRAYDEVMHIFNDVMEALAVGEPCRHYQEMTCDFFEQQGHKTLQSDPSTTEGYVHGLGHGLGLEIHSRPRLNAVSDETLRPGQVFTVEPGLYYPDKGFGVRIEDTVYIDEKGEVHSLTLFPKDLVIAMK
ncbi:MAG: aminopeptidase P family protein [Anaerolineae bacterium]|nr:aminopeptidase P family protein [Anaerolineae bacterium]